MRRRSVLGGLALATLSLACRRAGRRFPLRGTIQDVRSDGSCLIAHEDIPGFMPAMTMRLAVRAEGVSLAPGDRIDATLVVTEEQTWIEGVTVMARGLPIERPVRPSEPGAEPGALVPDFRLVNQDAAPIGLGGYRGKTLVLTFIYTRCPLPEYCPLMMRNFRKLDAALAAEPGLFARTHLLAISFDPAYDTPAVLRSFGLALVTDRGRGPFDHWELASGSDQEVRAVAEYFGLAYWPDRDQFTHSLVTAVIGPDGRLASLHQHNEWTVDEVLREVRRSAA